MSRLRKLCKTANWEQISVDSTNELQVLTDAMSYGSQVQINYKGSGWRMVLPYGWNSSQAGNVLLMCYKDTGEVRSYRLDRISELLVDESLVNISDDDTGELSFDDFEIPALPNLQEIIDETEAEDGNESPYDEALESLSNDTADVNVDYLQPDLQQFENEPNQNDTDTGTDQTVEPTNEFNVPDNESEPEDENLNEDENEPENEKEQQ